MKTFVRRLKSSLVLLLIVQLFQLNALDNNVSDSMITDAIEAELLLNVHVQANKIDVSTANGIVTLKGSVTNLLAKRMAERLVEATSGVRGVVNLITVSPQYKPSDRELAEAVKETLQLDPVADSCEIDVSAHNGQVTLAGKLDSFVQKDICEKVAAGVKGVKGIDNNIEVILKANRKDEDIKKEIKARLKNDVRVDDYLVSVAVSEGVVSLSGKVGSLYEKKQAYRDAWVAGVRLVDITQLDVVWWARDKMKRKNGNGGIKDADIKKAVIDTFYYDPRVLSFKPEVAVHDGVVTLKGNVSNLTAKKSAEHDARNVIGVKRVRNNLKVRPDLIANSELRKLAEQVLDDNIFVEKDDIVVEAKDGWLYLSGLVNTSLERDEAVQAAEKLKSVVGVVNNIRTRYQWKPKPDWEILDDVKERLKWNPFVDESHIQVTVAQGIVTLSGNVNTLAEVVEAQKSAFKAGAKDVINKLNALHQYLGPYGPEYQAVTFY